MRKYLTLFTTFFKIGLFTFGGGLAMIPFIEKEAVSKHKWIDEEEMISIIAIAESTPGPIAVNSATYIGNKAGGLLGSFFATLGVILPSFTIILLLTLVLEQFMANNFVKYAFLGIRASVTILILNAALKLFKKVKKSVFVFITLIVSFVIAFFFTSVSTIYLILGGLLIGIIYYSIEHRLTKKEVEE